MRANNKDRNANFQELLNMQDKLKMCIKNIHWMFKLDMPTYKNSR